MNSLKRSFVFFFQKITRLVALKILKLSFAFFRWLHIFSLPNNPLAIYSLTSFSLCSPNFATMFGTKVNHCHQCCYWEVYFSAASICTTMRVTQNGNFTLDSTRPVFVTTLWQQQEVRIRRTVARIFTSADWRKREDTAPMHTDHKNSGWFRQLITSFNRIY